MFSSYSQYKKRKWKISLFKCAQSRRPIPQHEIDAVGRRLPCKCGLSKKTQGTIAFSGASQQSHGFCRFPLNYTLLFSSTASADLNLWICLHLLSSQKRIYKTEYLFNISLIIVHSFQNLTQYNLKYMTLTARG